MKTEDMISILEHFQQYCPSIDKDSVEKILCGGDGLSTKRGMEAQNARADAPNQLKRLQGLIMKSEDWHEAVICLQVSRLYQIHWVRHRGGGYLVCFVDGMFTPSRVSISPLFSSAGYPKKVILLKSVVKRDILKELTVTLMLCSVFFAFWSILFADFF